MLNLKEIKSVSPDFENRFIWVTLKNGEIAKIKIPNNVNYEEQYAILKNKVHKTHEVIGKVNQKLKNVYIKNDRTYLFVRDYDGREFTKEELIQELGCKNLISFMSVYRNTGSYYGETFKAFKNGEEIELYKKENKIEVAVFKCLETGEVKTGREWCDLLGVSRSVFYTYAKRMKRIGSFSFRKYGTRKVGRAKNDI